MMCAGFVAGGRDSCTGDSGGPLFVQRPAEAGGGFAVLAVVSWGIECAAPNAFGVYASVSHYHAWIAAHVPELAISPPPPAPPPATSPPPPPECPAAGASPPTCALSAAQRGMHCACHVEWRDGCPEPAGVRLHCE